MEANQWTVVINTWRYHPEQVERATAPLVGWAKRIIWVELGIWHRDIANLCSIKGPKIHGAWPGSFRLQYDQILQQEQDFDTSMVLFLEANEVIARMDLRLLDNYVDTGASAYRLPVMKAGEDVVKKEVRILRSIRWRGFQGIYKADPYPPLVMFREPVLTGDVPLWVDNGDLVPTKVQLEALLGQSKAIDLINRARWLLETREFSLALRLLKKEIGRTSKTGQRGITLTTLMAEAFLGVGKAADALKLLTTAMSIHPSCDRAYLLAQSLYRLGRYEEASTYFYQAGSGLLGVREAQEPGTDSYSSLLWAVKSLRLAQRPKDSFVILTRLLENYPFFHEAWTLFFEMLGNVKPEDVYEIISHILPAQMLGEVVERLDQQGGPEGNFRQWWFSQRYPA